LNCQQCGKCCDMGTIWVNSEHPLVRAAGKAVTDFRDGGSCDMLVYINGKAVCLIHKYFGYDAKPEVCRDYPEEGEQCRRTEK